MASRPFFHVIRFLRIHSIEPEKNDAGIFQVTVEHEDQGGSSRGLKDTGPEEPDSLKENTYSGRGPEGIRASSKLGMAGRINVILAARRSLPHPSARDKTTSFSARMLLEANSLSPL